MGNEGVSFICRSGSDICADIMVYISSLMNSLFRTLLKSYLYLLLSGKSFSDDKNKAETLLQDFSLFCYFACWKKTLVT